MINTQEYAKVVTLYTLVDAWLLAAAGLTGGAELAHRALPDQEGYSHFNAPLCSPVS